MALPLWGQLQKSLEDNETIEEAIIRLIQAHNDDPDGHNNEGQSLYKHKVETVLDHPVGSVLADKETTREDVRNYALITGENWTFAGQGSYRGFPGLTITVDGNDSVSSARIDTAKPWLEVFNEEDYSQSVQFSLAEQKEDGTYSWRFGNFATPGSNFYGYGFEYDGTYLRGVNRDNVTTETTGALEISMEDMRVYSADYDAQTNLITYYVNGVQLGQIERLEGLGNLGNNLLIRGEVVSLVGDGCDLVINQVKYSVSNKRKDD